MDFIKNTIKTYKDLKNRKFYNNDTIPKIVFRTGMYKANELPKEVFKLYETEMQNNKDYELYYFDDDDLDNFVLSEYGIFFHDWYNRLIPKAFQADFWRYLVLYKYGGIYLDFTMHTLIQYDEIVKNYKEVYVRDTCDICGIYNAFIATKPNSSFMKKAIEKVVENIANKYKGVNAIDVTGPTMLGRIFKNELDLDFRDWLPTGEIENNIYIYSNPSNSYIQDGDKRIIKNRIDNHYEITYNEKLDPRIFGIKPINHYNRLWADDKIFKN